ncbi:MAG: peptidoglycan-binding protein, partial [Lysobacterales bacterium]
MAVPSWPWTVSSPKVGVGWPKPTISTVCWRLARLAVSPDRDDLQVKKFMMTTRLLFVSVLSVALCFFTSLSEAQTSSSSTQATSNSFQELVLDVQRMLSELGYQPGPVDGSMGDRTRQAIR